MTPKLTPSSLRLLVLVDLPPTGDPPRERVRSAIRGGATLVQLRGKQVGSGVLWEAARELGELCREKGVPLFVNDRPDVARSAGADGVHVGPDDLPPHLARQIIGSGGLGVSARTPDRVVAAESARADYVGAGALRSTGTKALARVIGIEGIRSLAAGTSLPVVAIGGVRPEDAAALKRAGAAGMAVLSGIMEQDDPERAARLYSLAWARS
jgi:thiamine-phosphate diphosphorylase